MNVIYLANTNIIELGPLTNNITGALITTATVNATLKKKTDNTDVAGQIWPISLAHIADGIYRGTLPHTIGIEAGKYYTAHVTADAGANLKGDWKTTVSVQVRR
jgi:hypothetical protein